MWQLHAWGWMTTLTCLSSLFLRLCSFFALSTESRRLSSSNKLLLEEVLEAFCGIMA